MTPCRYSSIIMMIKSGAAEKEAGTPFRLLARVGKPLSEFCHTAQYQIVRRLPSL
jgi:hypothetical protein